VYNVTISIGLLQENPLLQQQDMEQVRVKSQEYEKLREISAAQQAS
jgi:hypothetical protein